MASYGLGFAQGMNSGSSMARGWLSAYDWGKERELEEEAGKAGAVGPEEYVERGEDGVEKRSYKLGDRVQDKPFTDSEIDSHRTRAVADVYTRRGKAKEGLQLRQTARQGELTDIQTEAARVGLSSAKRAESQAGEMEAIMQWRRRIAAGDDPNIVSREMVARYAKIPQGPGASITQVNGVPHFVLTDEERGESQLYPVTSETVMHALDQFQSLVSPQAYEAHHKRGLEERKVKATEKQAATMEGYRNDQRPVLNAQSQYYGALADRARRGPQAAPLDAARAYELEQRKLFDAERNKIISAVNSRAITEAEGRRQLNMLSVKFGAQLRQDKPGGLQGVPGNPGAFTDGEGRLFVLGENNQLTEVQRPQDIRALGQTIVDNLGNQQGGQQRPGRGLQPRDDDRLKARPKEKKRTPQEEAEEAERRIRGQGGMRFNMM